MEMRHTYAEPKGAGYFRHNGYVGTYFADPVVIGKNGCGEDLTLLCYPWDNPHPEKAVVKIEYKAVSEAVRPILTAASILVKNS